MNPVTHRADHHLAFGVLFKRFILPILAVGVLAAFLLDSPNSTWRDLLYGLGGCIFGFALALLIEGKGNREGGCGN